MEGRGFVWQRAASGFCRAMAGDVLTRASVCFRDAGGQLRDHGGGWAGESRARVVEFGGKGLGNVGSGVG